MTEIITDAMIDAFLAGYVDHGIQNMCRRDSARLRKSIRAGLLAALAVSPIPMMQPRCNATHPPIGTTWLTFDRCPDRPDGHRCKLVVGAGYHNRRSNRGERMHVCSCGTKWVSTLGTEAASADV